MDRAAPYSEQGSAQSLSSRGAANSGESAAELPSSSKRSGERRGGKRGSGSATPVALNKSAFAALCTELAQTEAERAKLEARVDELRAERFNNKAGLAAVDVEAIAAASRQAQAALLEDISGKSPAFIYFSQLELKLRDKEAWFRETMTSLDKSIEEARAELKTAQARESNLRSAVAAAQQASAVVAGACPLPFRASPGPRDSEHSCVFAGNALYFSVVPHYCFFPTRVNHLP